ARIWGSASAGVPNDGDVLHSADAFGAVGIVSKGRFVAAGGKPPLEELTGSFMMRGGSVQASGKGGRALDPYYLTVTDVDTGEVSTQPLMRLSLDYNNAEYSVDDTGISFKVDRNDPNSFVSLDFSSAISPWVLNPYTY